MQLLLTIGTLGALGVAGCEDPADFESCPLSQSIVEACQADDTNSVLTCVVGDHPMCEESICASWEGSEPFCSRACQTVADCPADSTCEQHLGTQLCVPASATSPVGS